jgi:hypothetical protein
MTSCTTLHTIVFILNVNLGYFSAMLSVDYEYFIETTKTHSHSGPKHLQGLDISQTVRGTETWQTTNVQDLRFVWPL